MPIVSMVDLLSKARQRGYAVGYFESWDQYSLEAAIEAAEEAGSPTILGFGGAVVNQAWLDGRGLEEMAVLARCLAEASTVPTAILFNEARTLAQVQRGLQAGCNAVMQDSSHLSLAENLAVTRRVVDLAHGQGAAVESELGHLADASEPGGGMAVPTDPVQAAFFVESTGVDALAVSVGNVHQLGGGDAAVDLDRLAQVHRATPVPLVIHGGTGFPIRAVRPAVERGVAKFNVGTGLKRAFLVGMREALSALSEGTNVHLAVGSREEADVLSRGKARMKQEILRLMKVYGSFGQAAAW